MWISLARSLTALNSSELTQRMMGASSVSSRMSTSSSLAPFVLLFALLAEIAALVLLAAVDVVDDLQDPLRRHQHRLDLGAELHAQIVERAHVERIGHRHHHRVPLALDGQQPMLLGEADGDPASPGRRRCRRPSARR